MFEDSNLLDTPKRKTLHVQSTTIRASLKDFERNFANDNDGRKPSKDDIKANGAIAAQYKTYNRIRDVLGGKLTYEDFVALGRSPQRKRSRDGSENRSDRMERKHACNTTPRKPHISLIESYDSPISASPKHFMLSAVGPTPQRDGMILGLFDMISTSSRSSQTPSSTSRKRKLDTIQEEHAEKADDTSHLQTPRRRREQQESDLLEHLCGTPGLTPQTGRRVHSRTPISEGRKFMLSQFFATPSAIRTVSSSQEQDAGQAQTPLQDRMLGSSLTKRNDSTTEIALDATPTYLKRSSSFKDRLLSASTGSQMDNRPTSPIISKAGPPTLRHLRTSSKALGQILADLRDIEDDDHEDDLDALRELENSHVNVLAGHANIIETDENSIQFNEQGEPVRIWKKKGQKRSTKRSRIKPGMAKMASAPQFVAPEQDALEDEYSDSDGLNETNDAFDAIDSAYDDLSDDNATLKRITKPKGKGSTNITSNSADPKSRVKKAGMINPNASSHMNFRSLKIKNKNSKAKGRSRFSKRR